eukprot:gene1996-3048_t
MQNDADLLYDLLDDDSSGKLRLDAAQEALRGINSSLSLSDARELLSKADPLLLGAGGGSSGGAAVSREDFRAAVRTGTIRMNAGTRQRCVTAMYKRLKLARRRRFLMHADRPSGAGIDQEALVLQLAGGAASLAMYQEIFAYGLGEDQGFLNKHALGDLVRAVCPKGAEREAREVVLIACSPQERLHPSDMARSTPLLSRTTDSFRGWENDLPELRETQIDFTEFLLLMRGARLPVALSDMVAQVRYRKLLSVPVSALSSTFERARNQPLYPLPLPATQRFDDYASPPRKAVQPPARPITLQEVLGESHTKHLYLSRYADPGAARKALRKSFDELTAREERLQRGRTALADNVLPTKKEDADVDVQP